MRIQSWGALCALLTLFAAARVFAQDVVVLEFSGDKSGKLRTQVEKALKAGQKVKVVPLIKYRWAVFNKYKLRGAKTMTPQMVAKVSGDLGLEAAVEGAVGNTFFIRILDADGNELWSKELPVRGGIISADNARRLAQAIATAAKMKPKKGAGATPPEEETAPEEETPKAHPPPPPPKTGTPTTPPDVAETSPEAKPPESSEPPETEEQREQRERELMAESHTSTEAAADPDLEVERIRRPRVGPRLITFRLGAISTWRSYCSRPGVLNCKDYDSLPDDQKFKDTVDFASRLPYFGFGGSAELFPFANFNNLLKGLGASVGYSRGFSLTEVTSSSTDAPREVIASDEAYFVQLLTRYYFGVGSQPLSGYAGLRAGIDARNFDVDVAANTPLPGSHRRYFMVGADAAYPLFKWLRAEVGGSYFLNPHAGVDEVAGYGQSVSGFGFSIEGGFSGEIAGPFGYSAKFRMSSYKDTFSGVGSKWTQTDKGVAQETYTSILVTANAVF